MPHEAEQYLTTITMIMTIVGAYAMPVAGLRTGLLVVLVKCVRNNFGLIMERDLVRF